MEFRNYISSQNNILLYENIPNMYKVDSTAPIIFSPINSNMNINIVKLSNNNPQENFVPQNQNLNAYKEINNIISNSRKKTLVLDLDETLVHSSMTPFPNRANIVIRLSIAGKPYTIYVIRRPFLEEFLREMSLYYELIIFTASLSEYSKPLLKIIDKNKVVRFILNRENCTFSQGLYIKDLKIFNRDLKDIIIIDNSPASYAFNKENGIPILTWIGNPYDNELVKLTPLLKYLSKVNDVRPIINKIINKTTGQLDLNEVSNLLYKIKNLNNLNNNLNNQINNNFNNKKNDDNNNQINIYNNNNFNNYINIKINNTNIQGNNIKVVKITENELKGKKELENNNLIIIQNNNIDIKYSENDITEKNNDILNINDINDNLIIPDHDNINENINIIKNEPILNNKLKEETNTINIINIKNNINENNIIPPEGDIADEIFELNDKTKNQISKINQNQVILHQKDKKIDKNSIMNNKDNEIIIEKNEIIAQNIEININKNKNEKNKENISDSKREH